MVSGYYSHYGNSKSQFSKHLHFRKPFRIFVPAMRFLRSGAEKHEEKKSDHTSFRSSHPSELPSNPRSTPKTVLSILSYPKLEFMKAISTFTTLFLIIITCAISAILYLNENYGFSAALTIVWIVSLTAWIGKCMGIADLIVNKIFARN